MERAGQLSHCWMLLFLHFCVSAAADLLNITAESGQNVTLSCRTNNNNPITFLEWSKYGLKKGYLLLYRDEWFDLENQYSSFKNRVDLQDRQMKDGDVSLILKNVTINDNGTYECHVFMKETRRWKSVNIIYLSVVDPPGQTGGDTEDGGEEAGGEKSGSVGLIICLSIVDVVVFAAVGVLIYITYEQCCQDSHCPTTEPQIEMPERFLNSESPADEQRDRNNPVITEGFSASFLDILIIMNYSSPAWK